MRNILQILVALIITAFALVPPASADLLLTLSDGTNTITVPQGVDPTTGIHLVTFNGVVGNWVINVTTGIQIGSHSMDLNLIDVRRWDKFANDHVERQQHDR